MDVVKPRTYRAKELNGDRYVEGYYFEMPATTYCFTSDYEKAPIEILYCIVRHQMTDWCLPNEIRVTLIDPNTLEYADVIEKDEWWKMYEALHAERRIEDT